MEPQVKGFVTETCVRPWGQAQAAGLYHRPLSYICVSMCMYWNSCTIHWHLSQCTGRTPFRSENRCWQVRHPDGLEPDEIVRDC